MNITESRLDRLAFYQRDPKKEPNPVIDDLLTELGYDLNDEKVINSLSPIFKRSNYANYRNQEIKELFYHLIRKNITIDNERFNYFILIFKKNFNEVWKLYSQDKDEWKFFIDTMCRHYPQNKFFRRLIEKDLWINQLPEELQIKILTNTQCLKDFEYNQLNYLLSNTSPKVLANWMNTYQTRDLCALPLRERHWEAIIPHLNYCNEIGYNEFCSYLHKNLDPLKLKSVTLTTLPPERKDYPKFDQLVSLTSLCLEKSVVDSLEVRAYFKNLKALSHLDLSYSGTKVLDPFLEITSLKSINLSGCPFNIGNVVKLEHLKITELNLSDCRAENQPLIHLPRLTALTSLNLSFSKANPGTFTRLARLINLTYLNVSNTQIKDDVFSFTTLSSLRVLDISNTEAIRSYSSDVIQEKLKLPRIKLLY